MHGKWMVVGGLVIGLWVSVGCKSEPKLKPPDHSDEFNIPPTADARFNSPDYPKAAFKTNNDIHKTPDETEAMTAGRSMAASSADRVASVATPRRRSSGRSCNSRDFTRP